ncbi:MAG: dienelactone hydrolase family protein [Legionellaceae bacterium]|nr:dienelactone hydrolase family protein [Legionellaceae bacterium]
MHTSNYIYQHGTQELHGYLAYDDKVKGKKPAVIVAHDWTGRNPFACEKAEKLAELGYVGFALDMYGQGRLGSTNDEKSVLMQPLMADRQLLRARVCAAFEVVSALPEVDATRIAIIGFCFGGLCALDLARSGVPLKGAVSFHGLLKKPEGLPVLPIKARVLALHGYDDPMVRPNDLESFAQEMTEASVDWQLHAYGNTQHAFTNPLAHDTALGLQYNKLADQRSWIAMRNFLQEVL